MSNNPFDDDNGAFFALVNHEEQYSLWPTFKPVPGGWTIVHGAPDGLPRQEVLAWIDREWTDLRPKSLRDFAAQYENPQYENPQYENPSPTATAANTVNATTGS